MSCSNKSTENWRTQLDSILDEVDYDSVLEHDEGKSAKIEHQPSNHIPVTPNYDAWRDLTALVGEKSSRNSNVTNDESIVHGGVELITHQLETEAQMDQFVHCMGDQVSQLSNRLKSSAQQVARISDETLRTQRCLENTDRRMALVAQQTEHNTVQIEALQRITKEHVNQTDLDARFEAQIGNLKTHLESQLKQCSATAAMAIDTANTISDRVDSATLKQSNATDRGTSLSGTNINLLDVVQQIRDKVSSELGLQWSQVSERLALIERDMAWKICEQTKTIDNRVAECQTMVLNWTTRQQGNNKVGQELSEAVARLEQKLESTNTRVSAEEQVSIALERSLADLYRTVRKRLSSSNTRTDINTAIACAFESFHKKQSEQVDYSKPIQFDRSETTSENTCQGNESIVTQLSKLQAEFVKFRSSAQTSTQIEALKLEMENKQKKWDDEAKQLRDKVSQLIQQQKGSVSRDSSMESKLGVPPTPPRDLVRMRQDVQRLEQQIASIQKNIPTQEDKTIDARMRSLEMDVKDLSGKVSTMSVNLVKQHEKLQIMLDEYEESIAGSNGAKGNINVDFSEKLNTLQESFKQLNGHVQENKTTLNLKLNTDTFTEFKSVMESDTKKAGEERRKIRLQIEELDDMVCDLNRANTLREKSEAERLEASKRVVQARASFSTNSSEMTPRSVTSPTKPSTQRRQSDSGVRSKGADEEHQIREQKRQEELAKVRKRLEDFEKKWREGQLQQQQRWAIGGKPAPPRTPPPTSESTPSTTHHRPPPPRNESHPVVSSTKGTLLETRSQTSDAAQSAEATTVGDEELEELQTVQEELKNQAKEAGHNPSHNEIQDNSKNVFDEVNESDEEGGNDTIQELDHTDETVKSSPKHIVDGDESTSSATKSKQEISIQQDSNVGDTYETQSQHLATDEESSTSIKPIDPKVEPDTTQSKLDVTSENGIAQDETSLVNSQSESECSGEDSFLESENSNSEDEHSEDERSEYSSDAEQSDDNTEDSKGFVQECTSPTLADLEESNSLHSLSDTDGEVEDSFNHEDQRAEKHNAPTASSGNPSSSLDAQPKVILPARKKLNSTVACTFCGRVLPGKQTAGMHEKVCDQKPQSCKHCDKQFPMRDIRRHESSCPKRSSMEVCRYCDEHVAGSQLIRHETSCDWKPSKCQYCSMVIISRDIAKHELKCPQRPSETNKDNASSIHVVTPQVGQLSSSVPQSSSTLLSSSVREGNNPVSEDKVKLWSVDEVCNWLTSEVRIPKFVIKVFREMDVDGASVLEITESDLIRQFDIQDGRLRAKIVAAIHTLRSDTWKK